MNITDKDKLKALIDSVERNDQLWVALARIIECGSDLSIEERYDWGVDGLLRERNSKPVLVYTFHVKKP